MKKETFRKAEPVVESKRLSKAGKWRLKHPNGLGVIIHDMRAVMR